MNAIQIERVFRGHLGRQRVENERHQRITLRRQNALFQYFALQLQRIFRAFYSRKYSFDFAKRKQTIETIQRNGEERRRIIEEYAQQQAERLENENYAKEKQDIRNYAENLHHLLSTKHIRGVYNPVPMLLDVRFACSAVSYVFCSNVLLIFSRHQH